MAPPVTVSAKVAPTTPALVGALLRPIPTVEDDRNRRWIGDRRCHVDDDVGRRSSVRREPCHSMRRGQLDGVPEGHAHPSDARS